MIIKNKGYASYLIIVHGFSYVATQEGIDIDIEFSAHEKLNLSYKNSIHNKIQKLHNKLLNISPSK